jgi:hypothetical protein
VITIRGDSYRLREKRRVGVIPKSEGTPVRASLEESRIPRKEGLSWPDNDAADGLAGVDTPNLTISAERPRFFHTLNEHRAI